MTFDCHYHVLDIFSGAVSNYLAVAEVLTILTARIFLFLSLWLTLCFTLFFLSVAMTTMTDTEVAGEAQPATTMTTMMEWDSTMTTMNLVMMKSLPITMISASSISQCSACESVDP